LAFGGTAAHRKREKRWEEWKEVEERVSRGKKKERFLSTHFLSLSLRTQSGERDRKGLEKKEKPSKEGVGG